MDTPTTRRPGHYQAVTEPATGKRWAAVIDLAAELGCHPRTLYNHLGGQPCQPTVQGRVFRREPKT